jgi:hypothetical protein
LPVFDFRVLVMVSALPDSGTYARRDTHGSMAKSTE